MQLTGEKGGAFAFSTPRRGAEIFLSFGLSRGLGLAREVGVAAYFGTTAAADALSAAFVVSSFAVLLVSEAVGATAIRRLSVSRDMGAALERWAYRLALPAVAAYLVVAIPMVALLTRNSANEAEGPLLALALAPCVLTSALAATRGAALALDGRIGRVTFSQACWSAGALLGICAVAAGVEGPLPVATGWTVGNLGGYLVLRGGIRLSNVRDKRLDKPLARASLAIAAAYGMLAFQGIIGRAVASYLETGAIAALGYADRLFLLPVGFVLGVYGPAVLGHLSSSDFSLEDRRVAVAAHLQGLIRYVVPLSLLALATSPWLVDILYGRGEFGERSEELTLGAFDGLISGAAAAALALTLFRVMQALRLETAVLKTSVMACAAGAACMVPLAATIGVAGVALGTSVSVLATACVQVAVLRRRLGVPWATEIGRSCLGPAFLVLACGGTLSVMDADGGAAPAARLALCLVAGLAAVTGARLRA